MAKIKIKDLAAKTKITRDEMKRLTGGISMFREISSPLPGDSLYSFKVEIEGITSLEHKVALKL